MYTPMCLPWVQAAPELVASTTTLLFPVSGRPAIGLCVQMKLWWHFPTVLKQRVNEEAYAFQGENMSPQNMSLWHMYYIFSWRPSKPSRLKKNFYLSLHCLKEFRSGAWPRTSTITRDNSHLKDLCVWQGKHLVTQHLLFLHPVNCPLPLCKPKPLSHSLAQDGI